MPFCCSPFCSVFPVDAHFPVKFGAVLQAASDIVTSSTPTHAVNRVASLP